MCMLPYCTHAQNTELEIATRTKNASKIFFILRVYELRVIEKKTTVYY